MSPEYKQQLDNLAEILYEPFKKNVDLHIGQVAVFGYDSEGTYLVRWEVEDGQKS
jgi:hypothetical protein